MTKTDKKDFNKLQNIEAETMLAILTTHSYHEAAQKLGLTDEGLILRRKKLGIDEKINTLPQEALQRLKIYSVKAADVFGKNLDNRQRDMTAAAEILDRVGVGKGPQTIIDQRQINIHPSLAKKYGNIQSTSETGDSN